MTGWNENLRLVKRADMKADLIVAVVLDIERRPTAGAKTPDSPTR